jgi:hypothetical protein
MELSADFVFGIGPDVSGRSPVGGLPNQSDGFYSLAFVWRLAQLPSVPRPCPPWRTFKVETSVTGTY